MKFLALATIVGLAAASPCTPPPSNSAPQADSSKGIRFMVHVRDPKTDLKPSVDKTWLSSLRVGAGVNAVTQDKDHGSASVFYVNGTAADVANHKADLVSDITFDGTDPSRLQTLGFTVADEPVNRPDHSPLKNTGLDSGVGTSGYGVTLKNQKQPYVTISGPNAQYPSEWYFCKQQVNAGPPVPILMTFIAGKYIPLPKDCALVDLIPECAELKDSVPNDPRHKLAVNSQCYNNPASVNWSKIN